jgi:hypothetical protein
MKRQPLKVGDRVRYASPFLRTIGAVTGWTPAARGTVTSLWGSGFASVLWDVPKPDGDRIGGAHLSALERCR